MKKINILYAKLLVIVVLVNLTGSLNAKRSDGLPHYIVSSVAPKTPSAGPALPKASVGGGGVAAATLPAAVFTQAKPAGAVAAKKQPAKAKEEGLTPAQKKLLDKLWKEKTAKLKTPWWKHLLSFGGGFVPGALLTLGILLVGSSLPAPFNTPIARFIDFCKPKST